MYIGLAGSQILIRPATSIYAGCVVALLFPFETEPPSVSDIVLRIEVNIEADVYFMA